MAISSEEKIKQMFRMEEEIYLKRFDYFCNITCDIYRAINATILICRAQSFHKLKLQQKVFLAWQRRSQLLSIKADKLCRLHLLRKGVRGLMFAVEHQKISVGSFAGKREKALVLKCWRLVSFLRCVH